MKPSVIENISQDDVEKRARLRAQFVGRHQNASALTHNLASIRPTEPKLRSKAGQRGRPYRRLINYKRTGPFHRQIGTARIGSQLVPRMQVYYVHTYLHATKGKRVYVGGESMTLPLAHPPSNPVASFYGRHGRAAA